MAREGTDITTGSVPRRPSRIAALDGIRALSALYVLMFHGFAITVPQMGQALPWPIALVRSVFGYGHFAVCVFIVLSGFSLALPMSRAGSWATRRDVGRFMRRRGRRLLPPYFAALALSLLVIAGYQYDGSLTVGGVMSHLFLLHNFSGAWADDINGPMWSVATEWQIYLLMPLLLIPMWRRIGPAWTIASGWLVPTILFFVLPDGHNFAWAAFWFIGSFALGMLGAQLAAASERSIAPSTGRGWGVAAGACFVGVVLLIRLGGAESLVPVADAFASAFAFALIMWAVLGTSHHRPTRRALRVLEAPLLVYIAGFSYSLYLVQQPVFKVLEKPLGALPASYGVILVVQLVIGTPIVLAVAWLFGELFERPLTGGGTLVPRLSSLVSSRSPRRSLVESRVTDGVR